MKTIFKPIGFALAMLFVAPGVSFGLGIDTLQPVVSKPDASILVADDDDRPFWWRHGKPVWQGSDDDWDDNDDDRWDDDDDDD